MKKVITDIFLQSEFPEILIKNYYEENDNRYLLAVYVQYLEKLRDFTLIYHFLPERMKIEKVKKLVSNLQDKIQYVIPIRNLK